METLKEYLASIYPQNIRGDAFIADSITDNYDEVRGDVLSSLETDTAEGAAQVVITTATEPGIIEWELFLGITPDPTVPLEERRSTIFSKVYGGNTTLEVLKSVVYSLVGGDETSVVFYERWTDPATTGDGLFTYEIRIDPNLTTNEFSADALRDLVQQMHPSHCIAVIFTNYGPFSWVDESSPGPTPYEWVSENNIFEGRFWSA